MISHDVALLTGRTIWHRG